MVGQTMHIFGLSSKAVYLSYSLSQQMALYVFWIVAFLMLKSQQTMIEIKTYLFG